MSAYLTSSIYYLLSKEGVALEQIDKLVGKGKERACTPVQLWAHYFVTFNSNLEEFVKARGVEELEIIRTVIDKAVVEMKDDYLTTSLSDFLLDCDWDAEKVRKVSSRANTPIELWAQYFVSGTTVEKFLQPFSIEDPVFFKVVGTMIDTVVCLFRPLLTHYPIYFLLSDKGFPDEDVVKVLGNADKQSRTLVELWAQCFVSGLTTVEYVDNLELKHPKMPVYVRFGIDVVSAYGNDTYINTCLRSILLDKGFSKEDINRVCSKASTPKELWAHCFVTTNANVEEFARIQGIDNPELIEFIRYTIDKVVQIM